MNVGDGMALLCQMEIVRTLEVEPAARILLGNLLRAAARPLPPLGGERREMSESNLHWIVVRDGWIFEGEFDTSEEAARETKRCNYNYQGSFTYYRCEGGMTPERFKSYAKALGF